jgi:hypothetical protein
VGRFRGQRIDRAGRGNRGLRQQSVTRQRLDQAHRAQSAGGTGEKIAAILLENLSRLHGSVAFVRSQRARRAYSLVRNSSRFIIIRTVATQAALSAAGTFSTA